MKRILMQLALLLYVSTYSVQAQPREVASHGSWTVFSERDRTGTVISAATEMAATGYSGTAVLTYTCVVGDRSEYMNLVMLPLPSLRDLSFRNGYNFVDVAMLWEARGSVASDGIGSEEAGIAENLNRLVFVSGANVIRKVMRYDVVGSVLATRAGGAITLSAQLNGSSAAITRARNLCRR